MKAVRNNMIPVHLEAVLILSSETKKWQNNLSRAVAVYGKIDTTLLKCECSCIICTSVENIFLNNCQLASFGDVTTSLCCTLMNSLNQCFSTPSPWTHLSPQKALAESASTMGKQVCCNAFRQQ